ncbi:MAG: hypothetical protein VW547_10675, partial [Alphaproteobacteria bacterium]
NWGIAGSIVAWNATSASGSLAAKKRQNMEVKDTGGILRPEDQRPGINNRQAQPVRGGLKGSTRSRDF